MTTFVQIIGCVVGGLILAGWVFRLLDVVTDTDDKEKLKEKIERFWIETSDIGLTTQLQHALAFRYARTRAMRFRFLKLFWACCAIVAIFSAFRNISEGADQAASYRALVQLDFGEHYVIHCAYLTSKNGTVTTNPKDYCFADNSATGPIELRHYSVEKKAYEDLIDRLALFPSALTASFVASTFVVVLAVVIPLSFALWVSFNITLRLLSRITKSRLYFSFLLLLDFAVAIFMPPLLTSVMMLCFVGAIIFAFGQVPDFFAFREANWLTLTFGFASFTLALNFFFPAMIFLLAYVLSGFLASFVLILMSLVAPALLAWNQVFAFFADLANLFRLDFSADEIRSAIDFAIFTDLLFSATYLGPCLLLVLANRSDRTRKTFLNVAMWIHDHNKGPFIAISELLSSVPKNLLGK